MAAKCSKKVIRELLDRLRAGEPVSVICRDAHMPNRKTIYGWQRAGGELGEQIDEALELGFHEYAEETVRIVSECADPQQGRNILAARTWFLGRRSRAFADKPAVGLAINVDVGDAFAAVAGVLEGAAAASASRRDRTYIVDADGTPRAIDAPREGLAQLAAGLGSGVRED